MKSVSAGIEAGGIFRGDAFPLDYFRTLDVGTDGSETATRAVLIAHTD